MNDVGRTRVKICGITRAADAWAAVELGADALGFNTYPGSPRFIHLQNEAHWIAQLPTFVTRVAVMVNPSAEEVKAVFNLPFIDAIQFHGREELEFCRQFESQPFIKAIALENEMSLNGADTFGTRDLLIDAYRPGEFGGTGRLIDLDLAARFVEAFPMLRVVLSGGLTPQNVAHAIKMVRPFAVDVASGVESEPGKKDPDKIRGFISAVTAKI